MMDINQLLTNKVQETLGKLVFDNINLQVQSQVDTIKISELEAELKQLPEDEIEITDI